MNSSDYLLRKDNPTMHKQVNLKKNLPFKYAKISMICRSGYLLAIVEQQFAWTYTAPQYDPQSYFWINHRWKIIQWTFKKNPFLTKVHPCLPSGHMASKWYRTEIDATSLGRIDSSSTSFDVRCLVDLCGLNAENFWELDWYYFNNGSCFLKASETPQIVVVSFENNINSGNVDLYRSLFAEVKNPNGCEGKGSFYIEDDGTDYEIVKDLFDNGHEIGIHSLDGTTPKDNNAWLEMYKS